MHSHMHTHTHTRTRTHTLTHAHTLSHTHALTHALTHAHTHTHTHSHTHTHTRTHTLTLSHTQTQNLPGGQIVFWPIILSALCRPPLQRPRAPASPSRAHSFFLATQRALLSSAWQWQCRMIGRLWNGPMEKQGRVAKWSGSFWTSSFWPRVSFSGEQSDFWPAITFNATLHHVLRTSF